MKKILWLLLLPILIVSCLYEKGGVIDPLSNIDGQQNPTTPNNPDVIGGDGSAICDLVSGNGSGAVATNPNGEICFDTQILPLIVSNCATSGCHDSKSRKEGYELTSYGTITKKGVSPGNASNSKIYKVLSANGEERMPPLPKARLTAAQMKLIGDWIDQGAKNIVCLESGVAGGTLPDSIQISYSQHVKPIMDFYCVGCHTAGSASGGVQLNAYSGVNTSAQNGTLYGSVAHLPGFVAMPEGSKLSDCQIMAIKQWVDQGAKNN